MRFPILLARRSTLLVVRQDFFDGIGQLDEPAGTLDLNVAADGQAGLQWLVDAEGRLQMLTSLGLLPPTWPQRLKLMRRRQRYRTEPTQTITAEGLLALLAGRQDEHEDAPHVSDLRQHLAALPPQTVLSHASLAGYFGE